MAREKVFIPGEYMDVISLRDIKFPSSTTDGDAITGEIVNFCTNHNHPYDHINISRHFNHNWQSWELVLYFAPEWVSSKKVEKERRDRICSWFNGLAWGFIRQINPSLCPEKGN